MYFSPDNCRSHDLAALIDPADRYGTAEHDNSGLL